MDSQKVTQVLKQIFDINGGQIIQNKNSFKAAVFDLLDELHYKDERTVLKYAIECNAIPALLSAPQITGDAAERAVNEIQRECHMAREDAEFVVGCVVAACGSDLEVVTENVRKREAEHEQKEAGEQAHQREERKSVSHSGKRKYMGIAIGMAVCMALFVLIGITSKENSPADQPIQPDQPHFPPIRYSSENIEENDSQNLSQNVQETKNILMAENTDQGILGNKEVDRNSVVKIKFFDSLEKAPDEAWDVSKDQNGSVMAWISGQSLFIAGNGIITFDSGEYLFSYYRMVREIDFNDCVDTSSVMNMDGMFSGCEKLEFLNVNSFNTRNVTTMISMFSNCDNLESLDLSGFDTGKVTAMQSMFIDCGKLRQLDISRFDTGSVTDMDGMFSGCDELESLNVSSFDTSQVTDMAGMFEGCGKLQQLDISRFDTGSVINMRYMFSGCQELKSLNVSSFDTSQVISMEYMFYNCKNLESLDLSNFNMSNVRESENMLDGAGANHKEITREQAGLKQ